ncbi:hypothetical protein T08_9374 [Trichinella sp. T8]|nr:hypothetical protein T08_9374 [Trichinella sp. T8]
MDISRPNANTNNNDLIFTNKRQCCFFSLLQHNGVGKVDIFPHMLSRKVFYTSSKSRSVPPVALSSSGIDRCDLLTARFIRVWAFQWLMGAQSGRLSRTYWGLVGFDWYSSSFSRASFVPVEGKVRVQLCYFCSHSSFASQ